MEGSNTLVGKLELDKMFAPGDVALVVLDLDAGSGEIRYANLIDHYRLHAELLLFVIFAAVLVFFARWTGAMAILFGNAFRVNGAVRPFSETLLYTGFPPLDLTRLFTAGTFLASSGAVMDVAMDVAAAMEEVRRASPGIPRGELVASGFKVGRAVIGTMTTTLLLAYSGGYTALLMVFMAQGTPIVNILNLSYVSAEILHTLAGSFGVVLAAPATAAVGGLLMAPER